MDGRQEYSLERSRLLAAGLVMTPGYVEPSQPTGPSSLLRGGLADLGRSAPPPPHPSPGTPGLSSAAAFQQYHGRCLSSIPNSAGTNFQSFLNGVLTGSMPAPASSPYRAPPGVPSIRHLWPPVPPTPEGYGRCGMNAGLYSLFPMVSSSDTSSSLYSQTSLSRLATSQNSFQHLCENPKDLVFPSGIQLSTMIPPPQHLPHTSPSTPSLQELERNGLSQMEYYPTKGLDNGSRRSVDLWSDLRTVTRNDSNNNTMPNPTNGLLSPHSHPYQSHGSKKREQHVRHLERKSEATDERRGLREGGKKPREIKQESVRKEDAAVCKKPHCNDDVITGRQPESYAARCTPLHGDAPGSSGRDQGGKAVATPAPVPGPQPDKRSADPETARDSPVKTEKPSADKCQVRTQATVTVTTTTLTQSSGGTNTLTTTPSPRDNEYPTTPYAQRKTTATKVVSSVLTTSSNLNISSSNNKDNLKEHSVNNITKLASVPSGNALTTSQVKQPDRSSPFVNHTPTSLNGVTSTSPVVISNSEKQWKGVQTVKPVLDKTENKHSSLEIPQKSCTSRVVIKQETTYESSCVSGRKFSTAIDTSVSIRSSTGKDCMFVNNTSHLVNSDIKNSDGLCNSQSAFIGQRQTNTLSKSSANVLISKKDPHTKQNKRKIGKLYPIHSQYSRNTVHKETVKLHDNSQSQYCDIVSNCCLPKSSVQIGTAAKVDSSSHSNSADIMSISERQSVTSLQTMIAGTDHPQAALISVPENLPSTMTDQSCTTSALPPQYVFEWSSPQFSTASVTTLTTHPSYLIQHSSQTLHPDANSSTVTACTCTQGPIIVQTIPKTVIATTVDNASSDLLVNSHPPDHIILSHRANSNTHTSAAHEVKDMTSTLTQVVPVSVLTDNINDKTDLSKVQEQSTNDGPLLLHNPAVACSIPIGIAVARQRQEHSPSHTPIKRNEETIVNEEPTTDNCGAIDLRGEFLREQKEFLPRPKQPHTSNPPADLGSSIMVPGATTTSTGQWDDSTRTGAGLPPPWVPAPHSSAYWIPQGHYAAAPAPIPMQIGTMETSHLPIPPVGYQLVRDSITGHLLLIPANIDLMDRPTMWPTYATPATHLQSSHQLQQLIVHQQLLQQDQHRTMEYRLTVPQQFSSAEITKNQNTDMQNIEEIDETAEDCSDQNEQCENMQQSGLFADKKEDKDKSTVTISATPSAPPPAPPSIIASIPIAASQTFPFAFPAAPYFYEAAGVVQLAQAVQTDTGRRSQGTSPVLPDDCISMPIEQSAQTIDDSDSCESDRVGQEYIVTREEPQVADASNQTETPPLTEEEEDAEDVEASQISNGSETEKEPVTKQDVGVPCDSLPSDNEIQPSEEEEITTSEALKDVEIIDMHGLELLSNSIKVHEESHLDKMPQLEKSEPESVKEDKIEINQPKLEPQEPLFSNEGESSSDEKPPNIVPEGESPASLFSPENSMLEGIKTLGGLKLLCALAEQKFLDENLSSNTESEADKSSKPNTSSPKKEKCKNLETSSDLNRNYRNPKTQKEFKNLIANKMTQYMQPGAPKTPPGNDNLMDAAELEMRMRLADLQRRYKEKQRELAKLQPKKEKEECEKSPVKRGPGRPRKRKFFSMAKKMQKTSVENLVKNVVRHEISQPNFQTVIDEPSRKKKKKQGKLFNPIVCMSKSSPNSSVNKITNKPILKPPLLKANNLHNPTLVLINNNNKAKKPEEPSNATSIFHSTAERTNQLIKSKYGLAPQQPNPLTISAVKVQILSPVKDAAKTLNDQSGLEENAPETVKWVIENKTPTTELHSPSKTFGKSNALTTIETPKKTAKENTDKNKKVPGGTSSSENAKPVLSCESPSLFDKSDGLGLLAQFATHVVEQSRGEKRKHKETEGDATDANKSPTTASLSPSLSSSSKKRKPGRPKKHSPSRLKESTETIVAKKPKNINFLKLSQVIEDKSKKVKTETNKSNSVSETKAYYLEDEAWQRRRSERIFLNELNIVPSGGYSESGNRNILSPPHLKPATEEIPTWKTKTDEDLKPPKNLTRAPDVGKTKKKTTKSEPTKKQKTKDRQKRSKDRTVPEELFQALKEKCRLSDNTCGGLSPRDSDSDNLESSSYSEGENLPLSQLVERPITPEPRSCIISSEELADKLRVLTLMDGLFYAGHVNAIQAPDVYGITFDGERGNRPHIYSREEILKKVFLEVKPGSVRYLPEGTRISAYWSQQYRCLYPGTVAKSTSPNPVLDKNSVYVEFDDGDSGRIPLNDIRLLPPQFPIVSYDPSPLVFLGKRRSRSTQDSDKSNTNTDDKQKNSHKFNKMEETVNTTQAVTSVTTTNANVSSSNTSLSGSSKEKNGEETKKKSKKLKSESREKSRKSEDSNVNDSDMPNEINKPKKHKKHRDKDRPEEHRHHHHHHHHHHKHKHKHDRHEKHGEEKESFRIPSSNAAVTETHKVITTVTQQTGHLSDPKKSEFTMKFKTNTSELGQFEPSVTEDSETCNTWESSDSCKVTGPSAEVSENSDEDCATDSNSKKSKSKNEDNQKSKKRKERLPSVETKSKIAAFLPARQLWRWSGKSFKRPGTKGKAKKEFYKAITRGKETIMVGDCAVFLSTGRPHLPYIGRIEMMWEAWGGNMVVKVKWFYHPEETKGGRRLTDLKGALYQSPHVDENDVQTISHKCEVLSREEYKKHREKQAVAPTSKYESSLDNNDVYYLAGTYDPTTGMVTMEPGIC